MMAFTPPSIEKSWWSNNTSMETASLSDSLNSSIESDTTSLSTPEVLRKRFSPSSSPAVLLNIDDDDDDDDNDGRITHDAATHQHRPRTVYRVVGFLCLLGTFLVVVGRQIPIRHRGPPFTRRRWTRFMQNDAPVLLQQALATPKRSSKSYTVLLQSSRADLLANSLQILKDCASPIEQIQVRWNGPPGTTVPRNSLGGSGDDDEPPVVTKGDIKTEAVLVLSDDIRLTCSELDRAFSVWNRSPDRMVGFLPKAHNSETLQLRQSIKGNAYTLVSDRAAFVHRAFVQSFKTDGLDCGDIALSVRVTAISARPPLVVKADPQELRKVPSALPDTECLQKWIQGHGMPDLPVETVTYVGR